MAGAKVGQLLTSEFLMAIGISAGLVGGMSQKAIPSTAFEAFRQGGLVDLFKYYRQDDSGNVVLRQSFIPDQIIDIRDQDQEYSAVIDDDHVSEAPPDDYYQEDYDIQEARNNHVVGGDDDGNGGDDDGNDGDEPQPEGGLFQDPLALVRMFPPDILQKLWDMRKNDVVIDPNEKKEEKKDDKLSDDITKPVLIPVATGLDRHDILSSTLAFRK